MRARRRSGGNGPMLAVLGLGAVLAGLVYVFWDKISAHLEGPPPKVTAPEPRRPVERRVERPAPPERRELVNRPPEPKARPDRRATESAILAREREAASDLRRRAENALKDLDFALAEELFGKAASTLRHDSDGAAKAKALATKAGTFLTLTKDAEPNPAANKTMVTLALHSGKDIRDVVLVEETDDGYLIARRGMQFEVPRRQVRTVKRMSPAEQRARLLKEFEALESKARSKPESSARFFELADRAFRDGLKEKALTYLEKAFAIDGADLPSQLRIAEAKEILRLAIWCDSTGRTRNVKMYCHKVMRLYPDLTEQVNDAKELLDKLARPVAVADYKSTVKIKIREKAGSASAGDDLAPEDEEATVVTEKVSSGSARNDKLMAEINEVFDEAMDHYVKGRPGNPGSNMHLRKAWQLFDKVSALCDKALKNDPGNSQIQSRQADANRYGYHSRKMSTL